MKDIKRLEEVYDNILSKYSKMDDKYKIEGHKQKISDLLGKEEFQKIHHKICELMFKMAEFGEELWIQINQIYREEDNANFREQNQEREKSGNFIEFSIVTPTMLDYDKKMFELLSEENNQNIYRPYFFHFLLDVDEADDKAIDFIRNEERLNQWYEGNFSSDWNRNSVREFPGYIEKAASPVIYSRGTLKISDRLLSKKKVDEINNTYDLGKDPCSRDSDIQTELNRLLKGTNFTKGRIYNVGTGNCIYLYGKKGSANKRLIFDIGYHVSARLYKDLKKQKNIQVTQAIRSLAPHCVILSHWDLDHCKGCAYGNRHIFQCRWIAPNCDDAAQGAKRLAKYLKVIGNLMLVDRTKGRNIATIKDPHNPSPELKVWMGEKSRAKGDRHITKQNCQGLVLELSNVAKDSHCIMMGDVPYQSIFKNVNLTKHPFDYLVVPHHGARMDTSLIPDPVGESGLAIVCAKRGPERPNNDHKEALTGKLYKVILTEDAGFSIELNLNKKNSWYFR